jgi:hypothetical protein
MKIVELELIESNMNPSNQDISSSLKTESASTSKRNRFTDEEDILLMQLVQKYGILQIKKIATFLPGKNERQCQDRWNGHLSPFLRNPP